MYIDAKQANLLLEMCAHRKKAKRATRTTTTKKNKAAILYYNHRNYHYQHHQIHLYTHLGDDCFTKLKA